MSQEQKPPPPPPAITPMGPSEFARRMAVAMRAASDHDERVKVGLRLMIECLYSQGFAVGIEFFEDALGDIDARAE